MNITSVTYLRNDNNEIEAMDVIIDGKHHGVPPSTSNRHYRAVQEWIAAGNTPKENKS